MDYELDIPNLSLVDDDIKSNAGGYQPSEEEIQASAKLTQALIIAQQAKKAREAQTGCKKPFLNIGKKKDAYEKCLADNEKKVADEKRAEDDRLQAQIELEKLKQRNVEGASDSEKKFLGMPQTTGIIVTILGVTALGVGAYFIWKKVSH